MITNLHRTYLRSIWQRRAQAQRRRPWRRRVPVLHQLSTAECGATCLAMILHYFGCNVGVAACREHCGVGRDGLSAQTILRAARDFGLEARAYTVTGADWAQVALPAIAYWQFNHFVVVEQWTPATVTIIDPAVGRRRLTAAEFTQSCSGVALTFAPNATWRAVTTARPTWRQTLLPHLGMRSLWPLFLPIVGASLLLQLLGLALPLLTQYLVDQILPQQRVTALPVLGIGLVTVVLSQSGLSYLRARLLLLLQRRLDQRLMVGFFAHVLALPFGFFQQRQSGDLLMRLSSTTVLREMVTSQTVSTLLDGLFVVSYLVLMLVRAPAFGLAALLLGGLQIGLLVATTRRVQDLTQRDLAAQAAAQNYLVEALAGVATLKVFGAEARARQHWSSLFTQQLDATVQRNQLAALLDSLTLALRTFAPLLLLWWGAGRVLGGEMSLGELLAFTALATAFLAPLAALVANGRQCQLAGAHLARVVDLLSAEAEQEGQAVQAPPRLTGQIEVHKLSFRYDPHGPWILRDISFTVRPGQKVALVGATASGKSTLARLLLGLYPPTAGTIRYDGLPLASLHYPALRQQWGVVLQEPFLFSGSIRQNIALNDPAVTLEMVIAAAQQAAIHEEILRMPMGYETLVGERGSGLSGGQCQRLALARAFVHQPALLLLDEATSHLDLATERQVDQQLAALACTRILIAHRLSTVRNADLILVLDQGEIVEQGTHEALLARGGYYAALVQGGT